MTKLIRKYLIPALIVALTGTGISYAATGSVIPPLPHDTSTTVQNTETTVETTPTSDDEQEEVKANENENESEQDDANEPDSSPVVRSTEGCPPNFTGTHGQFVSQSEDKQAAAHSPCGKPIQSVDKNKEKDKDDDTQGPETDHENNGKHKGQNKPGHSGDDEGENETGS